MRSARRRIGTLAWRALLTAALLFTFQGPAGAQYRQGVPVATLLVAGAYVTVNGTQAESGMPIRSGDRVITGPASSAIISFYAGGFAQLDANTDPDIFGAFEGYVGCWMRVFSGQTYSQGAGQGVCFGSGAEQILSQSAFNLQVGPGGELLTVAEGAVTVSGVQPTTVPAGSQASIASGGRIVSQRFVSPAELQEITAWRHQYTFPSGPGQYQQQPSSPRPYQQQPYYNPWGNYGRSPGGGGSGGGGRRW